MARCELGATVASVNFPFGNDGPVNEGERSVINLFKERLPDEFELWPNLTVATGQGGAIECDVIVLGPDCIWVVEVKDFAGDVIVKEHEMFVNGESRKQPAIQTRGKAQRLKSRLASRPLLSGIWVQPLVVLARKPASLKVTELLTDLVMSKERAVHVISDPTVINLQRGRISNEMMAAVRTALEVDGTGRPKRPRFGPYVTEELAVDTPERQWWSAKHELMGTPVLLEIVKLQPALSGLEQAVLFNEATRAAKFRGVLGPREELLTPESAFHAEDGSVVVVHPNDPAPDLRQIQDQLPDKSDEFKRRIVARIATAVAHCHFKKVIHRTIGPGSIFVPASGYAKLGGFSRASMGSGQTTIIQDVGALGGQFWAAPETLQGKEGPWADVYALGKLIQYLWPDGAPAGLQQAAQTLTAGAPADRKPMPLALASLALPVGIPQAEAAPATIELKPGTGLGSYRLDELIGKGASGQVWKATNMVAHYPAALKIYARPGVVDELQREFQILQNISNPYIVKVRSAERVGGRSFLVSDYLNGPNLGAKILPGETLLVDQGVSIVLKLLGALATVHPDTERIAQLVALDSRTDEEELELENLRASGVTHRDLKPENIILVDGERPVIVDFGLAASGSVGVAGGTPEYRPRDVPYEVADPDLDLFAIGVILHQLITGSHPYSGADPVGGDLEVSQSLPVGLINIIKRACAPDAKSRFRSANEFVAALAGLGLADVPLPAPKPSTEELLHQIKRAMLDQRWDDALTMCPAEWAMVRSRIEAGKQASEAGEGNKPLLEVGDYKIYFDKEEPFELETAPNGPEEGPGTARHYVVNGSKGEMLRVVDFQADSGVRWVQTTDSYQTALPLSRLKGGLRIGSQMIGGNLMIELWQARINNERLHSNRYGASREQLDHGARVNVEQVLTAFGASAYGTRAEVYGETNNNKNRLCYLMKPDNDDAFAIAYFLTRVLPLAHGITVDTYS